MVFIAHKRFLLVASVALAFDVIYAMLSILAYALRFVHKEYYGIGL
jgi:energy-converting hydrogenase Eha subunit C